MKCDIDFIYRKKYNSLCLTTELKIWKKEGRKEGRS